MRRTGLLLSVALAGTACHFTFDRALNPGDLRGTVVFDTVTGGRVPAAGATIALENSGLSVTADAQGAFVLTGLQPGVYALTITDVATPESTPLGLRLRNLTMDPGSTRLADGRDLGQIEIAGLGAITGSVTGPTQPVPAGTLVLSAGVASAPVTQMDGSWTFQIPNLPSGDYDLTVFAPGATGALVAGPVTVHVPPLTTVTASPFLLDSIQPASLGAVSGLALVMNSAQESNIEITLTPSPSPGLSVTTDDTGLYSETELAVGVYTVTASLGNMAASVPFVVIGGGTTTVPTITIPIGESGVDAGMPPDAGILTDAGIKDAGPSDGGVTDGGSADAGQMDAGFADAGFADAGGADAGLNDGGLLDAGVVMDAGTLVDAGTFVDAGPLPDAGPVVEPSWTTLISRPGVRSGAPLLYDTFRSRYLTFGGSFTPNATYLRDNTLWYYDPFNDGVGPNWVPLSSTMPFDVDWQNCALYDYLNDRIIAYSTNGEIWVNQFNTGNANIFEPGAWSIATTTGAPPARSYASLAYDESSPRAILFGGLVGATAVNELWALDLTPGAPNPTLAWSQLTFTANSATPPALYNAPSTVITAEGLLVFGGVTRTATPGTDGGYSEANNTAAYEYDFNSSGWFDVNPGTGPGTFPAQTVGGSLVYEDQSGDMVLFGGTDGQGNVLAGLWVLAATASPWPWTHVALTTEPTARTGAGLAIQPYAPNTDGEGSIVSVFGGFDGSTTYDDLWSIPIKTGVSETWTNTQAQRDQYVYGSAIYDATDAKIVLFGGYAAHAGASAGDGAGVVTTTVASPGFAQSSDWTAATINPPLPAARSAAVAVWDSGRDRMIVFGGDNGLADTWALALSSFPMSWTELNTGVTAPQPGARSWAAGIYDSLNQQLVVFGGSSTESGLLNDTWIMPMTGANTGIWSQASVGGTPPSVRSGAAMVYDPDTQQAFLFGGVGNGSAALSDVWTLALPNGNTNLAWSQLSVQAGSTPAARQRASLVYDSAGKELILFAGSDGAESTLYNDLWLLDVASSPAGWAATCPTGTIGTGADGVNMLLLPSSLFVYGGYRSPASATPVDMGEYTLGLAALGPCQP